MIIHLAKLEMEEQKYGVRSPPPPTATVESGKQSVYWAQKNVQQKSADVEVENVEITSNDINGNHIRTRSARFALAPEHASSQKTAPHDAHISS